MAYLSRSMCASPAEVELMNKRRREAETCSRCSNRRVDVENDRTWQQWQCGSCGSWEDRTDTL